MEDERPVDPLTHAHLSRFGSIVHTFARVEYLMQATMGRIIRLSGGNSLTVDTVVLITKPMTYSQKRDALLSLMEAFKLSEPAKTEITTLFNAAHNHNALRNHVAHALWRRGTRPESIKPAFLDLRQGKGRIGGYEDEDRDYTLEELSEIADKLLVTRSAIIQYLKRFDETHSWQETPVEPDANSTTQAD
jgi:hypothetical protein